jgi:sortase (surface protein transpeptidase)
MSSRKGSLAFLIVGAFLIIFSYLGEPTNELFYHLKVKFRPEGQGSPAKSITIPSLNINLAVEEGFVTNGTWVISDDSAHINTSANPGTNGNVVVYGHNKNNLWSIRWIKAGSEIKLVLKIKKNIFIV